MALEQTIKDLQAQHAQFQETLMNLAQGKKELLALVAKKKKTKKPTVILNMGRMFKGPAQPIQVEDNSSEKDDNHDEDGKNNQGYENTLEDEDFSNEQYPPVDDRYKKLEDRLKAMEIQQVSGLDFGELGLVPGVVISPKFKVSFPKLHLRSYVKKI